LLYNINNRNRDEIIRLAREAKSRAADIGRDGVNRITNYLRQARRQNRNAKSA